MVADGRTKMNKCFTEQMCMLRFQSTEVISSPIEGETYIRENLEKMCQVHRVQNGSGAHPASYPMGSRGSFPGGKAAGA
jgi:hypothetical protein